MTDNLTPVAGTVSARVVGVDGLRPLIEVGGRIYSASDAVPAKVGEPFKARVLARDGTGITLGIDGKPGLALSELPLAEVAAALGLPETPETRDALSLALSLGRPLDAAALRGLIREASQLAATFGPGNLRAILLLRMHGVPVSAGTLRLAAALLAAGGGDLAGSLASLLKSLSGLKGSPLDPARFFLDPGTETAGSIRELIALLGRDQATGVDLPGLLRSLALLTGEGLPDPAVQAGLAAANLLDAFSLESLFDANRLVFALPWTVDGRPEDVVFEYLKEEAEGEPRHRLTLSTELADLGPVRAALDLFRGALAVNFHVATPEARQRLETEAGALAAALAARGYAAPAVRIGVAERTAIPLAVTRRGPGPTAAPRLDLLA